MQYASSACTRVKRGIFNRKGTYEFDMQGILVDLTVYGNRLNA
jgi:hypothetical protein